MLLLIDLLRGYFRECHVRTGQAHEYFTPYVNTRLDSISFEIHIALSIPCAVIPRWGRVPRGPS